MSLLEIPGSGHPEQSQADRNVIELGERMAAPWCAPLRQVEAYWTALRNGRVVPARSDIDPRGIEGALEFAFIAERIAPEHARIRIAGSHLCDLMGMEVRGMPLSALISPVSRNRTAGLIASIFDDPAILDLSLTAERRLGKPALSGRMLLLPMSDDFGDISRVLGCIVSDGRIGRAPRRFEVTQHALKMLCARTETQGYGPVDPPITKRQMADPARSFRPGPVPYLRVVQTEE